MSVGRAQEEELVRGSEAAAISAGALQVRRQRRTDPTEILEALALRGTCVKDGGAAHAMLLVPMRPEQQRLLPVREAAKFFALARLVRRATFCGLSPQPWRGHGLEQEMLKLHADRQLALALSQRQLADEAGQAQRAQCRALELPTSLGVSSAAAFSAAPAASAPSAEVDSPDQLQIVHWAAPAGRPGALSEDVLCLLHL